jgi:hypothetical protein
MKKLALILTTLSVVLMANCQTKKKGSTKPTQASGTEVSQLEPGQVKVKYRVVVSFTSPGSGIDGERYDKIENYIKTHPKKPAFEILPWGREGERDIALNLKELSTSEQKTFIEELKKMAQGSDRTFVNENTERVKKQ